MTRRRVSLHLEHSLTSLHEQQSEAIKLDTGARLRQARHDRKVAANVLVCRSFNEGRKELGYGG